MAGRKVVLYYAWSRPGEIGAPLDVIENRFPTLFESRRMGYPRYEELSDPSRFDQSVAGFLDHIMKHNFSAFIELAGALTGQPVAEIERVTDDGSLTVLDRGILDGIDTLIVISFDSLRTGQGAGAAEIAAVREFLAQPDHLAFVCPHHDIGDVPDLPHDERVQRQIADFLHHGDKTIPPQQQFGGFSRALLAGLGVPVENRFGFTLRRKPTDPLPRSRPRQRSTGFICSRVSIRSTCTRICRSSNVSARLSPSLMSWPVRRST